MWIFSFVTQRSFPFLISLVGMSYVLTYDATFWPIFVSLMLAVATLLMILSHMADTIARAIFGAYFMIIANDYFIGGNLKYIMITMIRRVTIPEFRLAFVYPPLQTPGTSALFSLYAKVTVNINGIFTTFRPDWNLSLDCFDNTTAHKHMSHSRIFCEWWKTKLVGGQWSGPSSYFFIHRGHTVYTEYTVWFYKLKKYAFFL